MEQIAENATETRESGTELDYITGDDCSSSQQLNVYLGDFAETLTNGHTTPSGYYNDVESVDRRVCTPGPNGEDFKFDCDRDVVFGLLAECLRAGSVALNLSRKGLAALPDELFHHFQHLEYLYLEGNELEALPDEFFGYFPRLKWLDLRNNRLKSIPSAHLLEHLCLRTILLERNELRTLPPELGLIRSLDGLNIRYNSLEFPPAEVIAKGTKKLLAFLRHLMRTKSRIPEPEMVEDDSETAVNKLGESRAISGGKSRIIQSEDEPDSESECSSTDSRSLSRSASHSAVSSTKFRRHRGNRSRPIATALELGGGGGFRMASASSLRCLSVNSSGHRLDKKYMPQSEKYVKLPEEPVSEDKVRQTFVEEKRRARVRKTKIKQDEIIQNWKDQDMIKGWREEAKRLQAKKMGEKRTKGFIDYVEAATAAPFGINDSDLKVMTNSERIAQRMTKNMNENQPRPMSPGTMQRLQEIRDEKERLLREKVRLHTEHMRARRARPVADPLEQMKAAQNEIEIAKQLQKEIEMRRKELEYRFTAHAVDAIDAAGPRTRYTKESAKH